jgi:hypothetical protein
LSPQSVTDHKQHLVLPFAEIGTAQSFPQMIKPSRKSSRYHFFTQTLLGGAISAVAIASAIAIGGSFLLFLFSLHDENQRQFVRCRANGNSVDYCLKLISGV